MKNIILIVVAFQSFLFSQSPDTLWLKTYGGANYEEGYLVQQTNDGGFIVAGETQSFGAGDTDGWLVKTNSQGDTMWTQVFGGLERDFLSSVKQTPDNGYLLAGATESSGAGSFDGWLIKTDSQGNTIWSKVYGGENDDAIYDIDITSDGNYILAGSTSSFGANNADRWLIKVNTSGDTLWTKIFNAPELDEIGIVRETNDNGLILYGQIYPPATNISELWYAKTDASGNLQWSKTITKGFGNFADGDIRQTSDDGYIITTTKPSIDGTGITKIWLLKANTLGDTLWTRTYNPGGYYIGKSVVEDVNGDFIIAGDGSGAAAGRISIIRTNSQGDSLGMFMFGNDVSGGEASDLQPTSDDGFILTGRYSENFNSQVLLTKFKPTSTAIENNTEQKPNRFTLFQNYPNPFNPATQIQYELSKRSNVELIIYNQLGQEIKRLVDQSQPIGNYLIQWDGTDNNRKPVSSGIYFYQLKADGYSQTKKMLLLQ